MDWPQTDQRAIHRPAQASSTSNPLVATAQATPVPPCTHPSLYLLLCRLLRAAQPLTPHAIESLDSLKDTFLDSATTLLHDGGIDLDARLIIGLRDGTLTVLDAHHPQAEQASALLQTAPELAAMLRRIAADSDVLRALDDLEHAVERCEVHKIDTVAESAPCLEDDAAQACEAYRICFKGALSHCYRAQ